MKYEDLTLVDQWETEPDRDEIPEEVLDAVAEMVEEEMRA